jgi:hypothetical protein
MDFSAFLIPSKIILRDLPLGEKPTSNVAVEATLGETGSFDSVKYTVIKHVTKANARKR